MLDVGNEARRGSQNAALGADFLRQNLLHRKIRKAFTINILKLWAMHAKRPSVTGRVWLNRRNFRDVCTSVPCCLRSGLYCPDRGGRFSLDGSG
jgi:hypothetical protein